MEWKVGVLSVYVSEREREIEIEREREREREQKKRWEEKGVMFCRNISKRSSREKAKLACRNLPMV